MNAKILVIICIAVLCTILTLGIWPFHSPKNDVTWLGNRDGLRFGRYSTAIGSSAFKTTSEQKEAPGSLEIWLRPGRIWDSGTCLAFGFPQNSLPFLLRQSQTDLRLQAEIPGDQRHAREVNLYAKNVFRKAAPVFVTITSGMKGTVVYADGVLVKTAPRFRFSSKQLTGPLVLGDSPGQGDSWSGQLLGLAIYHRELTTPQVLRHYRTWVQMGRPETGEDDRNVALYLLDEGSGNVIHDSARSGVDLFIPERYVVLDQIFLEPLWKEFNMSRSFWEAVLKNIVGFIPFGFFFYAYLSTVLRGRRAAYATVILGTAVSLIIEILQAYLPTRDSGTTDLITNTLGTWIGVASYHVAAPILNRAFPWLPLVIQPSE